MELYQVTIEYRDVDGFRRWEKSLSGPNPLPVPGSKKCSTYVAVAGAFGGDPLKVAGDLAVEETVGPPSCWAEYMPIVTAIAHLGSVAVAMIEEAKG